MTHARQKGSLSRCHSVGRDQGGTRGRPRGETMGRAWPERFLKEAGAKRGMAKKGQSKEPKEVKGEVDRKHYPLRGRGGTLEEGLLSNPVQKLSRGQASGRRKKAQSGRARRGTSSRRARRGKSSTKSSDSEPSGSTSKASKTTSAAQDQGAGQVSSKTTSGQVSSKTTSGQVSSKTTSFQVSSKTTSGQVSSKTTSGQVSSKTTSGQVSSKTTSGQVSSKTTSGQVSSKTTSGQVSSKTTSGQVSSKTTSGQVSSKTTSAALLPVWEPRKRRLASLNAEAFNSLLLVRAEGPPATKVAKKSPQEGPAGGECTSTSAPPAGGECTSTSAPPAGGECNSTTAPPAGGECNSTTAPAAQDPSTGTARLTSSSYLFILLCNLLPLLVVTWTSCLVVRVLVRQHRAVRARHAAAQTQSRSQQQQQPKRLRFRQSTVAILTAMLVFQVDWTLYLVLQLASSPYTFSAWSEVEFFITTSYTTISPYVYGMGNNLFSFKTFRCEGK
ncbi:mucin-5AC-like [Clupea harengus]|uniref:Mucin-5AC-like n=1 Tax=Clupea harengus TaxID=7950 RepID=A0A6P8GP13_CLUHA|nr:mucin-5AC-like [Clupea harengus]